MSIVVQKYGGSSVASIEKIKNVAETLIKRKNKGDKIVVVVSAMGDTTDNLLNLANSVTKNPDKRELDVLLSTGEIVSSSLLAMTLKSMGYNAISFTYNQIGIKTSGTYGKSFIDDIDESKISKALREDKIVVVAGFQGINSEGDVTTLGRGGSDTTAVAIAAKLKGICEIYTDVDGIYNVDPRLYKNAKKLDSIDYEEILEMASLGAQIMHSRSIELAQKYNIPIYVGLSNSNVQGTIIREEIDMNMETKPVTGIATSDDDVAITLKDIDNDINILSELFENIGSKNINIDMISQTAPLMGKVNISFTIPKLDFEECKEVLSSLGYTSSISLDRNITKFSIVGIGMKSTSGVAARMFKAFKENHIDVKMITTSEIRITCALNSSDKIKAIELMAKEFNL
ncbi:aspartate kinase [Haloimpatiens sp. FM7315]|uniref:aspartate kinase n=1 Tax=Haloimpatiens sp. FM7315 TaxID=3298609 RepID=UPI0035A3594E